MCAASGKSRLLLGLILSVWIAAAPVRAQDAGDSEAEIRPAEAEPQSSPATQPATQPGTQPANPLRTPARMIGFFDAAVADGRTADALACLNLAQVDPEVAAAEGERYVEQLVEILARLTASGAFDRDRLPDEAVTGPQTLGRDPVLLVLNRNEVQIEGHPQFRWQFSASTVATIPELHQQLERLAALSAEPAEPPPDVPAPAAEDGEPSPLRSPYHLMEQFLVRSITAKEDPRAYVDAMACLDFSLLTAEQVEAHGPDYVDQLAAILAMLRAEREFDRERDLPREPEPGRDSLSIGSSDFAILIARQPDGTWRFAAATVQRIPEMFARLERAEAEAVAAGTAPAAPAAAELIIPLDNSSPRATMNLFLMAMHRNDLATAIRCMDRSRIGETDTAVARVLAGKLLAVLNRHRVIVLTDLPADPESRAPYSVLNHTVGRIEISRQRAGEREGEWLFSAVTVASIDALYEAFEDRPVLPEFRAHRLSFWALPGLYIREYVVPTNLKWRLLGLQFWQWAGLALMVAAAILVRAASSVILVKVSRRLLQTEHAAVLPSVVWRALRPTADLALLVVLWIGAQFLDLPAAVMSWVWWALRIVLAIVGVQAFYRLIDLGATYVTNRAAGGRAPVDEVLLALLTRTFKVLVLAVGFIVVGQALGFNVGVLLAGLGLGGLAFGLAAQDTLKNFFGLVNVVLDRPFKIGDWIRVGDAEGTVESIGLRSARLRTFYNSELAIPNAELMTARIDNMGRRVYRRFLTRLTVTYDTTPAQLEAFCEGVRELIRKHPYTRKDFYIVYVDDFAASSINIMALTYFQTPDWATEAREKHRLLLDIIRLAERLGVQWAFPTQTVHLHHESSPGDRLKGQQSPKLPEAAPEAETLGRDEAAAIVARTLPDGDGKPPPVKF